MKVVCILEQLAGLCGDHQPPARTHLESLDKIQQRLEDVITLCRLVVLAELCAQLLVVGLHAVEGLGDARHLVHGRVVEAVNGVVRRLLVHLVLDQVEALAQAQHVRADRLVVDCN